MSASSPHAATASSGSSDFPKDATKLELENQSLKRRLVQYAATLEKLTGHARREIDASVRARDDALAAAADAAVLREGIVEAEKKRDDALDRLRIIEEKLRERDIKFRELEERAFVLEDANQEREKESLELAELKLQVSDAKTEAELAKKESMMERDRADTLHGRLAELDRQLAGARKAETRIRSLEAEKMEIVKAKEAAEAVVRELKGKEETVRSERDLFQRKTSDVDDMMDKLRDELAVAVERATKMEQALRSAEGQGAQQVSVAEEKTKQAEDTVAALRAELDEVHGQLSDTRTALEEAREASIAQEVQKEAVEERDTLKANLSSIQDELDQSNELLTRAAIDALADKQRIRKLEDSLYKVRSTLNTEREERRIRDQKISQLNQSIQNAERELDDLRTTKRTLSEECHKLQLELHEKSNVVATKSRELKELGVARADRESTAQKLGLELSNSKNALAKKESEIVNLSAEYQDVCSQLNNASKELEGRHVEIATIRRELNTYKDRTVDLETEAERNKLTFSELQASRRQVQDLTEKSAEKDGEVAEMKRLLTATKNEAAGALREKKRLSDMLGEVSGDLKRANQELDILRGLRKDQEVLATRIAEMSASSARDLNLMKETQIAQAEALAKNTVKEYQRTLEEVQSTAQRDIAASVTNQLRDDLMPHLLSVVDQKAKNIVRNLARHVESFAIDVTTDSELSSSKHAETGAATDATSRSPSQDADNADSMLPQATNRTTASESPSVPRSAPGSTRAGVSEYADGSPDVREVREEDLTAAYSGEHEPIEEEQNITAVEHIPGDEADADETVDATGATRDADGVMSSEVFVMMTSDEPLTEDQEDLEGHFEAQAEYDDDDDVVEDRDYEPEDDAVVGEFDEDFDQYEEREIDITGADDEEFSAPGSGNEPAEDEVTPVGTVASEANEISGNAPIPPMDVRATKVEDENVTDIALESGMAASQGGGTEVVADTVRGMEGSVDEHDATKELAGDRPKVSDSSAQYDLTDDVDVDTKPIVEPSVEFELDDARHSNNIEERAARSDSRTQGYGAADDSETNYETGLAEELQDDGEELDERGTTEDVMIEMEHRNEPVAADVHGLVRGTREASEFERGENPSDLDTEEEDVTNVEEQFKDSDEFTESRNIPEMQSAVITEEGQIDADSGLGLYKPFLETVTDAASGTDVPAAEGNNSENREAIPPVTYPGVAESSFERALPIASVAPGKAGGTVSSEYEIDSMVNREPIAGHYRDVMEAREFDASKMDDGQRDVDADHEFEPIDAADVIVDEYDAIKGSGATAVVESDVLDSTNAPDDDRMEPQAAFDDHTSTYVVPSASASQVRGYEEVITEGLGRNPRGEGDGTQLDYESPIADDTQVESYGDVDVAAEEERFARRATAEEAAEKFDDEELAEFGDEGRWERIPSYRMGQLEEESSVSAGTENVIKSENPEREVTLSEPETIVDSAAAVPRDDFQNEKAPAVSRGSVDTSGMTVAPENDAVGEEDVEQRRAMKEDRFMGVDRRLSGVRQGDGTDINIRQEDVTRGGLSTMTELPSHTEPVAEIRTPSQVNMNERDIVPEDIAVERGPASHLNSVEDPETLEKTPTIETKGEQEIAADKPETSEMRTDGPEAGEIAATGEPEAREEVPLERMKETNETSPTETDSAAEVVAATSGSTKAEDEILADELSARQEPSTREHTAEAKLFPARTEGQRDIGKTETEEEPVFVEAKTEEPSVDESEADVKEDAFVGEPSLEVEAEKVATEEGAVTQASVTPATAEGDTVADMKTYADSRDRETMSDGEGESMTDKQEDAETTATEHVEVIDSARRPETVAISEGGFASNTADDTDEARTSDISSTLRNEVAETQMEAGFEEPKAVHHQAVEIPEDNNMEGIEGQDVIDVDTVANLESELPVQSEVRPGLVDMENEAEQPIDVDEYSDSKREISQDPIVTDDAVNQVDNEIIEMDDDEDAVKASALKEDVMSAANNEIIEAGESLPGESSKTNQGAVDRAGITENSEISPENLRGEVNADGAGNLDYPEDRPDIDGSEVRDFSNVIDTSGTNNPVVDDESDVGNESLGMPFELKPGEEVESGSRFVDDTATDEERVLARTT